MINTITIESIEKEVEKWNETLLNVRTLLIEQRVSNYPIFVFQKASTPVFGKRIIDQSQTNYEWNIFITHLEELYHKKLITDDKLEDFRLNYKDKSDMFCILFISNEQDTGFLFVPILY
jgi:hypothetical protein